MRKTTRGRHVQHVTRSKESEFRKVGGIRRLVPLVRGRVIMHPPEKPSPALDAPIGSKFVHYKLMEGYRRRVAAGKW